jgi:hypothetical protein
VVASYDKLVATGYLESRRGAGFFVRERSPLNAGPAAPRDGAGPGGRRASRRKPWTWSG